MLTKNNQESVAKLLPRFTLQQAVFEIRVRAEKYQTHLEHLTAKSILYACT